MNEILVDNVDADLIETYPFYKCKTNNISNTEYVQLWVDHKTKYLHRAIMERIIGRVLAANERVDHINGFGADNRRENLRLCSHAQNMRNQKTRDNTSSKYKGVTFYRRDKNWQAKITKDYKTIHIGYFMNEVDAAKAYNQKAVELFGAYARTNPI